MKVCLTIARLFVTLRHTETGDAEGGAHAQAHPAHHAPPHYARADKMTKATDALPTPNLAVMTLGDVKMAVDELCGKRAPDAEATRAGHLYMVILRDLKGELDGVPRHLLGGLPLVDALAQADVTYDGFGGAFWHLCEACKLLPSLSAPLREAATLAQQTFVPTRSILRASYAAEAQRAEADLPALDTQRDALLKLASPDGRTFAAVVQDFLGAGFQIKDLLSQRAKDTENSRRGVYADLRGRVVSNLTSFRAAHLDELRAGLSPLSSFDAVWNHTHMLAKLRADALNNAS